MNECDTGPVKVCPQNGDSKLSTGSRNMLILCKLGVKCGHKCHKRYLKFINLFLEIRLSVTNANDCLGRLVSEMCYYVSSWTLNSFARPLDNLSGLQITACKVTTHSGIEIVLYIIIIIICLLYTSPSPRD